jgi:ABC-type nitrate/sulfonate/bicarbonate transport system substrate-binding protein
LNGQVKGALLLAPFDTLAEREKMKILDVYSMDYVQTPLILNKDWAAKNRNAAIGLTKALQKAAVWVYDPKNKQKAINILAAFTNVPVDVCTRSYQFIIEEQQAIGKNLEVRAAGLENIIKIDQDIGANPASSKPFELSRYYDPGFLSAK